MNKTNRAIWEHPWGYIEGFYIAIGIALSGFLLQVSMGNLQLAAFQYPVNLIFGLLFIGVIILLHFFAKKSGTQVATSCYIWV